MQTAVVLFVGMGKLVSGIILIILGLFASVIDWDQIGLPVILLGIILIFFGIRNLITLSSDDRMESEPS